MDMKILNDASKTLLDKLSILNAKCVLILGSGWGDVANTFDIVNEISYDEIPGMGAPSVVGHAGCLRHCRAANENILVFQGRHHWYEGCGWTPVALPVYIAIHAQVENVMITNAAGGISENLVPGDLMMITDHINAMGASPLIGGHDSTWGERFPDQSEIYRKELQEQIRQAASKVGADLKEGVYLATSGPTYETPAEIRSYKIQGADAVGMSTVPEAILANAAGMKVSGISCITNYASGVSNEPLGHDEVIETTKQAMPMMSSLIHQFITNLCK